MKIKMIISTIAIVISSISMAEAGSNHHRYDRHYDSAHQGIMATIGVTTVKITIALIGSVNAMQDSITVSNVIIVNTITIAMSALIDIILDGNVATAPIIRHVFLPHTVWL